MYFKRGFGTNKKRSKTEQKVKEKQQNQLLYECMYVNNFA